MSNIVGRRSFTAIVSVLTIGAALSFGEARAVAADDVTEDQIVRALAPAKKPLTRGLSAGPQVDPAVAAAEGRFVQTIRGRATRSLSVTEREEIATIARDKPNIDLEITFDYNSADISAKSLSSVQALGKALTNSCEMQVSGTYQDLVSANYTESRSMNSTRYSSITGLVSTSRAMASTSLAACSRPTPASSVSSKYFPCRTSETAV